MILGGHFDLDNKETRLKKLENETREENFWQNIDYANKVNQEISSLKKDITKYQNINKTLVDNLELINIVDKQELKIIESEINDLTKQVEDLEFSCLLNEEHDKLNCYLEIHPGAGGTESCDWASMLSRMYQKFCDAMDYKYEIIEEQKGEEAGIKSVTLYIKGFYAYGYLKCEKGVHRLVRISPFDSNKRRHTSFASVLVTPEYNQDINIEIKESDLKIDVYHSSGAGGQSVNTSNSAVRITHLPTKVVVTCQNERSQLKNKEIAMKMLKNKLYEIELQNMENKLNDLKGNIDNINFGSQIRSYVLEPYKLIKDVRSNFETSNVSKVLDGEVLPIIYSVLKKKGNYEENN